MAQTATQAQEKVITATLLRGRVYCYGNVHYERDKPTVVKTEGLALELEDLYEEITDSEGDVAEKVIFDIDWEADPPVDEDAERKERLRARRSKRFRDRDERQIRRLSKMRKPVEDTDEDDNDDSMESPNKGGKRIRRRAG